jgi:hypothetical protein
MPEGLFRFNPGKNASLHKRYIASYAHPSFPAEASRLPRVAGQSGLSAIADLNFGWVFPRAPICSGFAVFVSQQ